VGCSNLLRPPQRTRGDHHGQVSTYFSSDRRFRPRLSLLHPASAFDHPLAVVRDPDLTLNEKRAILASWASDACAVDSAPMLRRLPGGKAVTFDDVVDALRSLDAEAEKAHWKTQDRLKRHLRRARYGPHSGHGSGSVSLH
jgi:hypothetical protein